MNIAIIEQGFGKYLFEVPESILLKEGEKVKCDTKRGVTDGTVWADSITVDEPAAKLIGKLLGAKFPLKSVVGKTVTSVEMFEQPEQPKQEPVKLYCVGDYNPGEYLTKGKVYEYVPGKGFHYDDEAGCPEKDYATWARFNPTLSACLVPLVSRPAKVGEWVYVTHTDYSNDLKVGDIAKVKRVNTVESVFISKPDGHHPNGLNFGRHEYLVLDGYKPEPEKAEPTAADFKRAIAEIEMVQQEREAKKAEPEYLNMRVVCVESTDPCFTVGKPYEFDGYIKADDHGNPLGLTSIYHPFKTLEAFNKWCGGSKFIEFKGE